VNRPTIHEIYDRLKDIYDPSERLESAILMGGKIQWIQKVLNA